MREVNDNPVDPLGTLGHPIKPSPIAKPDTMKPFESGTWTPAGTHIENHAKALETIVETLRKKSPRDEQAYEMCQATENWALGRPLNYVAEDGQAGAYIETLLGCI